MSDGLPPIPPIIAQLTGPVLIGHLLNWYFFGALTVQAYIYYLSFPHDRRLPKVLVTSVVVIELLQTVLATRDAFRNFGTGWGNMIDLNKVGWLWFSVPVMSSIISCTTQTFYAWRIYVLSGHVWISGVVLTLSLVQAGAGIWCGAAAKILGVFSEVQAHSNKPTAVWLGGTALCDVIIAVSMFYYLSRSRTGFERTNLLVKRIIRITIETGFICAAFAILDLSFFLRFPNNNYHLAPSIALSKLYSNSLLVVLNSRMRVLNGRDAQGPAKDDYSLSFVRSGTVVASKGGQGDFPRGAVRVGITHELTHDGMHSQATYMDQDYSAKTSLKRSSADLQPSPA